MRSGVRLSRDNFVIKRRFCPGQAGDGRNDTVNLRYLIRRAVKSVPGFRSIFEECRFFSNILPKFNLNRKGAG